MSETKRHPAILAGLMGVASWSVPTVAVATPLDEVSAAISESIVLQFAVGCAIGAIIAGTASVVYDRLSAPKPKAENEAEAEADLEVADEDALDDQRWSTSSLNLMRSTVDDDPTGDLGRMRTGRITIDEAMREETDAEKAEEKAAPRKSTERKGFRSRTRRGAHFATSRSAKTTTPVARSGRHFANATATAEAEVKELRVAPIKGRHFAAYVAANAADVEQLHAAEAARVEARHGKHAKGAVVASKQEQAPLSPRERLAQLPQIEPVAQPAEPLAAEPAATAEPAETPEPVATVESPEAPAPVAASPRKPTLRERMAKRTRNVREVLADRLSPDAMESIPVITRADGSAADIRPSWFDQTLVPVLASITGITAKLDDTATRKLEEEAAESVEAAEPAGESRADYISQRVAEVNVGMFPERRSVEDLEQEDMWEQALKAMGETIRQESPIFQDVVGGPATIDDPDGLEGPTGFIPFRVPAGRPEVVDTETYIDYLLRDEFSHNESQVIKRSSHAYLRVIEGGTNPVRARRRASETGSAQKTGRHFSSARYVAEA